MGSYDNNWLALDLCSFIRTLVCSVRQEQKSWLLAVLVYRAATCGLLNLRHPIILGMSMIASSFLALRRVVYYEKTKGKQQWAITVGTPILS